MKNPPRQRSLFHRPIIHHLMYVSSSDPHPSSNHPSSTTSCRATIHWTKSLDGPHSARHSPTLFSFPVRSTTPRSRIEWRARSSHTRARTLARCRATRCWQIPRPSGWNRWPCTPIPNRCATGATPLHAPPKWGARFADEGCAARPWHGGYVGGALAIHVARTGHCLCSWPGGGWVVW